MHIVPAQEHMHDRHDQSHQKRCTVACEVESRSHQPRRQIQHESIDHEAEQTESKERNREREDQKHWFDQKIDDTQDNAGPERCPKAMHIEGRCHEIS